MKEQSGKRCGLLGKYPNPDSGVKKPVNDTVFRTLNSGIGSWALIIENSVVTLYYLHKLHLSVNFLTSAIAIGVTQNRIAS